jgi:quercetin dioxygenase-like cupin family protein
MTMTEATEQPLAGKLDDLPLISAASLGEGVLKRIVFGPGRFFDDYSVRLFTLPAQKIIPVHEHDWPHYLITLSGHGKVVIDGVTWDLPQGSWAHVPADVPHSYGNSGDAPFTFLCIVPWRGDPQGRRIGMKQRRVEAEQ